MTRRALFRENTTGALDDGAGGVVHGVPDPSGEPDGKVLETSSGALVYGTPAGGDVAGDTHAAASKATPVNADEIPLVDSAASFALKKLTWANLKATIKTYTDTLYPSGSGTSSGTNTGDQTTVSGNAGTATALQTGRTIDGQTFDGTANITVIAPGTHAATGKTTPVDADELALVDSAASNVLKKLTWANAKATLKTYFDTLYTAIGASAPPNGSAGGDLGGTYPNPTVAALHETAGPTKLTLGSVPDGNYLVRTGSTIVGGSPTPGGPPTGAAGGDLGGTYPNPTVASGAHLTAASVALAALADPTTGKVIGSASSAAAAVFPPGYRIGYDQITTGVNVASTTEASGTTIITASSYTFDGALVRCEFFTPLMRTGTTSGSQVVACLFEGSTEIARLAFVQTPTGALAGCAIHAVFYFTPTAAAHTYKVTAFATNTTGTPTIGAGAGGTATNPPAFLAFFKA